jgi:phage-related protein
MGSSLKDLQAFPEDARIIAGHELWQVEQGSMPTRFKPIKEVGAGVNEIIITTKEEHRVFYVAKFDDYIYVLHAFQKTTRKTPKHDIDIGEKRYREALRLRKSQTEE